MSKQNNNTQTELKQLKKRVKILERAFYNHGYRLDALEIDNMPQEPRFKFRIKLTTLLQIASLITLIVMSVCAIIYTSNTI